MQNFLRAQKTFLFAHNGYTSQVRSERHLHSTQKHAAIGQALHLAICEQHAVTYHRTTSAVAHRHQQQLQQLPAGCCFNVGPYCPGYIQKPLLSPPAFRESFATGWDLVCAIPLARRGVCHAAQVFCEPEIFSTSGGAHPHPCHKSFSVCVGCAA